VAGHSKWHNIRHRKAAVDKKRGKVWTKIAKAIIVAAKNGGPDPASNLSLRYTIDEARYANMPRDTIERAIKKGAGGASTENFETVRYEGYGPGGVAIIVDALTDNRTRTVGDVRLAFSRAGGNLGASGCVAYLFDHRGEIVVKAGGVAEDAMMEVAIDAGAVDVISPDDPTEDDAVYVVLTEPTGFQGVKDAIERAKFVIREAQFSMIPQNRVEVRGEAAKTNIEIVEELEELDDVQKVFSNFTIPDDEAAKLV